MPEPKTPAAPAKKQQAQSEKTQREKKLAEALRKNLLRRKAGAKAVASGQDE